MNKKRENKPLTSEEESLKSYNAKLKREAMIKSLILALAVGFLLSAIVSIVSFATARNILWISLVCWAVATVGLSALFYFKLYRPNVKMTAERVDEVGLEERVITMVQFKDQDNPMLKRQREDAKTALGNVSAKQVKMRFPKVLLIVLAVLAAVAIFMMSYSTVLAVNAENMQEEPPVEEELSEEDQIIRELLEALREEIDSAKISDELRSQLHKLVDDLEDSLKPEDSLEVKVAKIMDTADKIHKLIEDYLNRSTIAEELMKHDTTYDLGKAIDSKDVDKMRNAFEKMYDSIEPLVEQGEFDILYQTAMDIDQSLKDAINTPPDLQKALEDLRDAFLRVFESLEESATEPKSPEEMEKEIHDALDQIQDAMDQAMDALEDFFEDQQQYEDLDDVIQDTIKDAMDQLGQEFEYPDNSKEEEDDKKKEEDEEEGKKEEGNEEENNSQSSGSGGDEKRDTVINGDTSYKDVFEDDGYSDDINDKLESGDLSDEDRQIIQDYLDTLK